MKLDSELLEELVEKNRKYLGKGHVATYIPALAKVDPNQLGASIYSLSENKLYSCGDCDSRFAIESISKVPSLILAILDNGLEKIFGQVGTEPSGFAFNSIMNMQINHKHKPSNPFINAGAIKIVSLIKGENTNERSKRILD
ncbi:MAG: glutaminase, partial [Methanobacterium sp.]|nr:glutaminase [Methanobacterium sp.]